MFVWLLLLRAVSFLIGTADGQRHPLYCPEAVLDNIRMSIQDFSLLDPSLHKGPYLNISLLRLLLDGKIIFLIQLETTVSNPFVGRFP